MQGPLRLCLSALSKTQLSLLALLFALIGHSLVAAPRVPIDVTDQRAPRFTVGASSSRPTALYPPVCAASSDCPPIAVAPGG